MTKMPYIEPLVICLGAVEDHTTILFRGVPDLVSHGNLI
ncbi:hypothetical protein NONI108955_28745 [Nocardia ninae]